jgi:hypothetical protein
MNLAKLDEAIAYIEAHPEEHYQSSWFTRGACGTTACLAGTVAVLDGWKPDWIGNRAEYVTKGEARRYVATVACELLGLDAASDEREYLFLGADTLDDIKQFRREYAAGTWAYPLDDGDEW